MRKLLTICAGAAVACALLGAARAEPYLHRVRLPLGADNEGSNDLLRVYGYLDEIRVYADPATSTGTVEVVLLHPDPLAAAETLVFLDNLATGSATIRPARHPVFTDSAGAEMALAVADGTNAVQSRVYLYGERLRCRVYSSDTNTTWRFWIKTE